MDLVYFTVILAIVIFFWFFNLPKKKNSSALREKELDGNIYIMPFDLWVETGANQLTDKLSLTHEMGKAGIISYLDLCNITYPDPDYEWSERSAIEFAEEYIKELYA